MSRPRAPAPEEIWRRWITFLGDTHNGWRRPISAATGLPSGRVRLLRRLTDGPLTLRDLAAAIGSDAPATTVIVNDLEARGLVVREPHPTNGRAKLVSLTAAGRAVVTRARRIMARPPPGFLAIAPDDLAALARVLDALTAPAEKKADEAD